MSLKLTGSFAPITGATKLGDTPPLFTPAVWSATEKTADWSISGSNNEIITNNPGLTTGGIVTETAVTTGKYYWEVTVDFINTGGQAYELIYGVCDDSKPFPHQQTTTFFNTGGSPWGGNRILLKTRGTAQGRDHSVNINLSPNIGIAAEGHVYGFAFDVDNRYFWAHRNGVWVNGGNIAAVEAGNTATAIGTGLAPVASYRAVLAHNGNNTSAGWTVTTNLGHNEFNYTVPTGFTPGFGT